mmetsp:Transcript_101383/g.295368  ORF Transcript_101383/g.295368 Transcript_101383/m.295368 type:complete len:266 (-) Transcript_101383:421-1218(-)
MGLLKESHALSWFFGPLGQPRNEKTAPPHEEAGTPDRAFDIADAMEKGLARELVSDFTQPLRDVNGLWRFELGRSADKREYRLHCARGEFLMLARVAAGNRRVDFFLYDSREGDPGAPAFAMTCDAARTRWRLVQERCDCRRSRFSSCDCCKRPVMDVVHSRHGVGSGVSHCLDVVLYRNGDVEESRLVSQLPVWNEEVQSMVLDFPGRQVLPSAKNLQLASEDDPERLVCQFAKLGPDSFGLDFKCPLTVAEAFGAALTTIFWV